MKTPTHCPAGHRYSRENTYRHNFKRQCRTCHADRERERKIVMRAEVVERTAKWLADLPSIIEQADRQAAKRAFKSVR